MTGWATDLKTVPIEMIESRVWRTGDGSHRDLKKIMISKEALNNVEEIRDEIHFWGFGDKDMTNADMRKVKIINNCSK